MVLDYQSPGLVKPKRIRDSPTPDPCHQQQAGRGKQWHARHQQPQGRVPEAAQLWLPAEAMWNFKMRWVGEGRVERYSTVFSQPGDGKFVPLVQDQWTATPLGNLEGKPATEGDGIEWMVLNEVVRPAARTGEIILVHYSQTNTPSARVTQHVWLLKAATALDRPPVHPREPRRNS